MALRYDFFSDSFSDRFSDCFAIGRFTADLLYQLDKLSQLSKKWFIFLSSLFSSKSTAVQSVLPQDLLLDQVDSARNEVIEEYFTLRYTATEILAFFFWNVNGVKVV